MKKTTLLYIIMLLSIAANADAVEVSGNCGMDGDNIKWTYNSEKASLSLEGTGEMASCNSGSPWDTYKDDISSIVIGEGITSVSEYAFQSVKATQVVLPSTLTKIEYGAFMYCLNLKSIAIPDAVESIGASAFEQCSSLTSVTLPTNLTEIPNDAFRQTAIKALNIPDNLKKIDNRAFYYCQELMRVNLPDGLQEVGVDCFAACTKLSEVNFPSTLNRIRNSAFKECTSLETVRITGKPYIDNWAFGWCSSLNAFELPDDYSDDYLNGNIFDGCESLPAIYNSTILYYVPKNGSEPFVIPDGIAIVAPYAFYGCQSVKQIKFPSTITKLGNYAFSYSSLEEADFSNLDHVSLGIGVFSNSAISHIVSPTKIANFAPYAFDGCKNLTEMDMTGIGKIEGISYVGNRGIGSYAFRGCENLKQVLLPKDVGRLDIEQGAFMNCSSLESFDFSDVDKISMEAFSGCSSLKEISISDFGESYIGTYVYPNAFSGCSNLEKVIIGSSGLQNLYMFTFKDCPKLRSIVINSQIIPSIADLNQYPYYDLTNNEFSYYDLPYANVTFTMFGYLADECYKGKDNAFWYKVKIERIYETLSGECGDKGDNITWTLDTKEGILRLKGAGAMKIPEDPDATTWKYRKKAIWQIVLADDIESICPHAFSGCAVRAIKLNPRLKSIGEYAFSQCSLNTIEFNDSLEFIDNWAFGDCVSLSKVALNNGLKRTGYSIFYGCSALTEATLPSSLTAMGEAMFGQCTNLKTIILPKDITAIPRYTFAGCKNLKDIYLPAVFPPSVTGYGNDQIRRSDITLHIPQGTSDAYKNQTLWELYKTDDYYSYISLERNDGGNISVGGDVVKADKWNDYLRIGQSFSVEFIPDDGNVVKSVEVNGAATAKKVNRLDFDALTESMDINITFGQYEPGDNVLTGDINNDGDINEKDVAGLADAIMGNPPVGYDEDAADINGDKKIDIADLVLLIDIIKNLK